MPSIVRSIRRILLLALAHALLAGGPLQAGFTVKVGTQSASPGATSYAEVTLRTDSVAGQTLSGFSIQLSLAGTGVTFTALDELTTAPYVFGTQGAGLLSNDGFPNTFFTASDLSLNSLGYETLDPNTTYGLARIDFQVGAGAAAGLRAIAFEDIGGATLFTDGTFPIPQPYSNVTYVNGGVDVTNGFGGQAVPAPPGLLLAGIGAAALACRRFGGKRPAAAS